MSSHPLYPNLDPTPRMSASFSRRIITDYLRNELGFEGVISSDDLEMGAIRELGPIGEAAVKTVRAGHDLILSCHDAASQREVYRALVSACRSGELSIKELEASVERIQRLKDKRKRRFEPGTAKPEAGGAKLALEVSRASLRTSGPWKKVLPLGNKEKSICVIFPRLSDFAPKIMIERPLENETAFLKKALAHVKARKDIQIVGVDASAPEIDRAETAARTADATVFFCFDAHLFQGCQQLLDRIQPASTKFVLALMRDHYDEEFAAPSTAVMTAFGFRICQITACLDKIFPK